MNKESIKKAYRDAEKELEENKIKNLKEVIKKTLEKIASLDEKIKKLEEEKRILKLDVDDFKSGRLDRIEERQQKDKKAKEVSVVEVHKTHVIEHHKTYDVFHWPYEIIYTSVPATPSQAFYCCSGSTAKSNTVAFTLNCSESKFGTSGTYMIDNKTVHLR